MKRLSVIDIGSNTMRSIIVDIDEKGFFKVLDQMKESVRLGEGALTDNSLSEAKIKKALKAMKNFKSRSEIKNCNEIIAVATEAVRKAPNKNYFIDKVKSETGIKIRILDGIEEAYYDFLGVSHSIDKDNGLIIDIGGSSCELIQMEDRRLINSISLPIGAINLSEMLSKPPENISLQIEGLRKYVREIINKVEWLKNMQTDNIIGVGGTLRTLSKIDRKYKNHPSELSHNYEFSVTDAEKIHQELLYKADNFSDKKIKGLPKDREDIFLGPLTAVLEIIKSVNAKRIITSGYGLREGIIFEYIEKKG